MTEFKFTVTITYRDAQAFNDIEPVHAEERVTKKLFEALAAEFVERDRVTVEVDPLWAA